MENTEHEAAIQTQTFKKQLTHHLVKYHCHTIDWGAKSFPSQIIFRTMIMAMRAGQHDKALNEMRLAYSEARTQDFS